MVYLFHVLARLKYSVKSVVSHVTLRPYGMTGEHVGTFSFFYSRSGVGKASVDASTDAVFVQDIVSFLVYRMTMPRILHHACQGMGYTSDKQDRTPLSTLSSLHKPVLSI